MGIAIVTGMAGKVLFLFFFPALTSHFLASSSWTFSAWKQDQDPDGQHKSRTPSHQFQRLEDVPRNQFPGSVSVAAPGSRCLLLFPQLTPEKSLLYQLWAFWKKNTSHLAIKISYFIHSIPVIPFHTSTLHLFDPTFLHSSVRIKMLLHMSVVLTADYRGPFSSVL